MLMPVALSKLRAFLIGSVRWKAENVSKVQLLMDVLPKHCGDILRHRIYDATATALVPVLENLIADGEAEGPFDIAGAQLTTELIMDMPSGRRQVHSEALAMTAAGDRDRATDHFGARMRSEVTMCGLLLGLSPRGVPPSCPNVYRGMLAEMASINDERADAGAAAKWNPGREGNLMVRVMHYVGFNLGLLGGDTFRLKLGAIGRLGRYALLGAPGWMRTMAQSMGPLMPREIRAVDASQDAAARDWTAAG